MTYSKDLKPKGDGGVLYSSADLKNIQAEIDTLKSAVAILQNKLTDMADLVETGTLKATDAVQTDQLSANLAVLGTAVVEGELAVSNGSGQDKDVLVNRNGVPEWGTPTDINAVNVLVTDTVKRATTVDHTGTVNEADSVQNVDQCETVGEAQKVTQGNAVTHADLVQVADVIQQTGDAQIVGDLDVTGTITQAGLTLDNTYIPQAEKGTANGVATLDNTGRVPASQLTIDAMEYKGKWNASTNTPALADGTGTDGDFYIVSVAGTQDLGSGSIDFYVNDRVLYNGSEWERVPSGQVDSVNGATGDVVLTGEDIAESTSDNLKIDRRLKNWLFVDGQGANATKTVRGYFSNYGIALITFDVNNVYQGELKLKINGTDYTVWLNNAVSSATNYTLNKGTYLMQIRIQGLTPYVVIDTGYEVFISRYADHATSADSATTATNATNAEYAEVFGTDSYSASESSRLLTVIGYNGPVNVGTSFIVSITAVDQKRADDIKIKGVSYNILTIPHNPNFSFNYVNYDNALNVGDKYELKIINGGKVILRPLVDIVESYSNGKTGNYIAYSDGRLIQWGVWSDLPESTGNHNSENFKNFPAVFVNTNYVFLQSRQFWNGATETPLACDNNLSKDGASSFNPKRTDGIYIAGWHNPVSWIAIGRWK